MSFVELIILIGLTSGLVIIITFLFRLYYKIQKTSRDIRRLADDIQCEDIDNKEIIQRLRQIEDELT
ncbi:MAG: hypothetical protein QCH99_09770 [Candidatus Bathyarchaeota archaeon]|nr:hypothetical protein [Candidatus Bathyarchaeum tardum]